MISFRFVYETGFRTINHQAQNFLFNHTGISMVMAPYTNKEQKIIGAIGVLGPMRINYARIVPLVDYTSKIIGRIMG